MKKKYQITLVVIGCLIVLIGLSYAYFMATSTGGGKGGSTTVETYTIEEVGFNVEGILEFDDLDIYPGHKNISKIKVTAIGKNDTINYKLVWEGINGLNTPLKYYVYKTRENKEASITCEKKIEQVGARKHYYETCEERLENLGNIITSGEITKSETSKEFILARDEVIKGTEEGNVVYYYVVLEYPNLEESQNIDMGGKFEGKVTVKKEEDQLADITIKKMYKETESGYEEITNMPSEGYTINTERSTCTNNATPIVRNNKVIVTNLKTSGTECNVYFDKDESTKKLKEMGLTSNITTPDFSKIAESDEGIYAIEDGMYGGTSYYWRGATTTNYLRFGGYCWRIVRINGDGSLRLIYDGTTCHNNGEVTTDSIAVSNVAYNTSYNNVSYSGWTYVLGKQRPETGDTEVNSNAKTKTEEWYNTNLASYSDKIADGKFCNDRRIGVGGSTTVFNEKLENFWYAGLSRVKLNVPTLSCDSGDVYTLKVGAITADEAILAGGKYEQNESYYLFNGQTYWAMTPEDWYFNTAGVFFINSTGFVSADYAVHNKFNIRPVINIRSDVKLSGQGTIDNPYIVKGAE